MKNPQHDFPKMILSGNFFDEETLAGRRPWETPWIDASWIGAQLGRETFIRFWKKIAPRIIFFDVLFLRNFRKISSILIFQPSIFQPFLKGLETREIILTVGREHFETKFSFIYIQENYKSYCQRYHKVGKASSWCLLSHQNSSEDHILHNHRSLLLPNPRSL